MESRIVKEANLTVEQTRKLLEVLNKDTAYREKIGLRYGLDLVVRRKDGSIKQELHLGNIQDGVKREPVHTITNAGRASVAGLMLVDVGGTAYDYLAIGTGTTASAATDTALEYKTHRVAGTGTRVTTTVTNDTAQLVVTFSGFSGSEAITEIGMFNAASAGTMLMRQVHAALNINWTAGDSYQATVKVQVT